MTPGHQKWYSLPSPLPWNTWTLDGALRAAPLPSAGVTWAGDVSPALGSNASRSAPSKVQVYHGASDAKEVNF